MKKVKLAVLNTAPLLDNVKTVFLITLLGLQLFLQTVAGRNTKLATNRTKNPICQQIKSSLKLVLRNPILDLLA